MIFFDIDETLLDNSAAERAAAGKFHALHKDVFQETLETFIDRPICLFVAAVCRLFNIEHVAEALPIGRRSAQKMNSDFIRPFRASPFNLS